MAGPKRSEAQRRHLVKEFRKGTLGKQAFRRLHGIGESTFDAWLREFASEVGSSSFLPVRVESSSRLSRVGANNGVGARIVGPRGVALEFDVDADPAWVAAVAREVL
jgi:hypothetical protein